MLTTLCLCLAVTSDLPPTAPGMPAPKPKLESPKAAGEQYTSMVRPVRVVLVVPQGFMVTNISVTSGTTTLGWQLGTPPFQVYGSPTLNGSWNTVGNSTLARSKAFPAGLNHFWRVRDQAKSILTINSNSQPRLTWTVPDIMGDSLGNFTVQKSTDQVNWSNIAENVGLGPGIYPSTARQANDATVPSPTVYYRLLQTTANGVTVPYDVANLGSQAAGSVLWALALGGPLQKAVTALVVDSNNNIYVAGTYRGTIDLSGHGQGGASLLTAVGSGDNVFLAKYNAGGGFIWGSSFGDAASLASYTIKNIVLDASGNIFAAGSFGSLGCLQKYNASGSLQWTKGPAPGVAPGTFLTGNVTFKFIDVDSQGNAVCYGTMRNDQDVNHVRIPMDFGDGFSVLIAGGEDNLCLARYNTSGNCLSARRIEPAYVVCQAAGLKVDRRINVSTGLPFDNIIIGASPSNAIDFGGGYLSNPTGAFFGALAKLEPDGTFNANNGSWQRTVGVQSPGDPSYAGSRGSSLALDSLGNVIFVGSWSYVANFGGGPRSRQATVPNGYMAKYRGVDGSWMWDTADTALFTNGNSSPGIAIPSLDANNNIYLVGSFHRQMTFGGTVLTSLNIDIGGHNELDDFISMFNSSGVSQWAVRYGSDGFDGLTCVAKANDGLIVGGYFAKSHESNVVLFGSIPLTAQGQDEYTFDGLLMKLAP